MNRYARVKNCCDVYADHALHASTSVYNQDSVWCLVLDAGLLLFLLLSIKLNGMLSFKSMTLNNALHVCQKFDRIFRRMEHGANDAKSHRLYDI